MTLPSAAPASATIYVRMFSKTKKRLSRLARNTGNSMSFPAAQAIEAYVAHELPIVDEILLGIAGAKAGRVVPHQEAMNRIDANIARIALRRRKKPITEPHPVP